MLLVSVYVSANTMFWWPRFFKEPDYLLPIISYWHYLMFKGLFFHCSHILKFVFTASTFFLQIVKMISKIPFIFQCTNLCGYILHHHNSFKSNMQHVFFCFFYFIFFISWRLITLQYCSGFCHTLKWISHGFTCVPHPDPPSHLPLHPIPLGLPSAPGLSTCLMHPTWAGDLFHPR